MHRRLFAAFCGTFVLVGATVPALDRLAFVAAFPHLSLNMSVAEKLSETTTCRPNVPNAALANPLPLCTPPSTSTLVPPLASVAAQSRIDTRISYAQALPSSNRIRAPDVA